MKVTFNWKRFGIAGGIILSLFGIAGLLFLSQRDISYPEGVYIGERIYTLEYALTREEQSLGLGERNGLCEACAMAFPFETPGKYAFWMKGMRFPLDIAWLSSDGRVVHIQRHVSPESKESYRPEEPASLVLEFNAGALDTVSVGDTVRFFSPQL